MQQQMQETRYSRNSRRKKSHEEHRKNSRRILEMNFTTRREKKLRFREKKPSRKSERGSSRNYRRQKTSNCVLRLSGLLRRNAWRKFSQPS
jgi:hypothetical protein